MGKFFGVHVAKTVLQHRLQEVECVYLSESRNDSRLQEIERLANDHSIPVHRVSKDAMNEHAQGNRHQSVVVICHDGKRMKSPNVQNWLSSLPDSSLIVVLDGILDPRNLGACIRSAHAGGAGGIILPRNRGCQVNATVSRTAAGAAEITPILRVSNLARTLDLLKTAGLWVIGLDLTAENSIYAMDLSEPCALVFGTEETGLRKETRKKCDVLGSIPMLGGIQSINVSVAVGVVTFETARQRMVD